MKKLLIYPTSRNIREEIKEYIELDNTAFLPKMMTIEEFLDRVIIIEDRKLIDLDSRILLLSESINFSKFAKLGIKKDFISFLKNSEFFFKFFEELKGEDVEINKLEEFKLYEDFPEHLDMLKEVLQTYRAKLLERGFYDKITIDSYRINQNFLNQFDEIEIQIEGYLTKSELNILTQVAKFKTLNIDISVSKFNKNMQSKLNLIGFNLEIGSRYRLNLSNFEVLESEEIEESFKDRVNLFSFNSRIMQINFIFERIYHYIVERKFDAQKIAIITPDEKFTEIIRLFDRYRNLNFAMGLNFREKFFYQKLDAIVEFLVEKSSKNLDRLKKLEIESLAKEIEQNRAIKSFDKFLEYISLILESGKLDRDFDDIKLKIEIEIYELEKLKDELSKYRVYDLLNLLLKRVREIRVDDIGGGKVTVLGVLESRGAEFDAVVVVDFNEEFVPKVSQKDMFLNSDLRERLNLPTIKDRENLQKYYYTRLFQNSKDISISYVDSENSLPSRFLRELDLINFKESEDERFKSVIFKEISTLKHFSDEIIEEVDLTLKPLSSSKLKTFLSCKRKFYYSYLKNIKEHQISIAPKPFTIGNILHRVLRDVLSVDSYFKNRDDLHFAINQRLFKEVKSNKFLNFDAHIWINRLNGFIESEIDRFRDGVKIVAVEKGFKNFDFQGFKLEGYIDRIDIDSNGDKLLIDYKSNVKNISKDDFQLTFYSIVESCDSAYLYDLKSGDLIKERELARKQEELKEVLAPLRERVINFEKVESLSNCEFCPYRVICNRDGK